MFWTPYLLIFVAGSTVASTKDCTPYINVPFFACREIRDPYAPRFTIGSRSRDSVSLLTPPNNDYNPEIRRNTQANTEWQNQRTEQNYRDGSTQIPVHRNPPPNLPDLRRTTRKPEIKHNDFSSNVFYVISQDFPQTNVVFSPFSIKALLGMINSGAEGETSYQIQNAVPLPEDKRSAALFFQQLIQYQSNAPDVKLEMANKLFYEREKGNVKRQYQDLIQNYFYGEVEGISFEQPNEAANKINDWAASKTGNRIRNLVSADSLPWDTKAVLVNTVYFKAKWEKPFSTKDTSDHEFKNGLGRTTTVPMMFIDDVFHYAEVPQIQAKMVELRYANSNMSMIIILPDATNGLREVEDALKGHNLNTIFQLLKPYEMKVRIPKFKIQFEVDLQEPLRRIGVSRLFADDAQLPGILENSQLKVSKMQQKAVLDVNEAGSEAAVSSFANFVPLALPVQQKIFTADHPFIFVIKLLDEIMFMGHYLG